MPQRRQRGPRRGQLDGQLVPLDQRHNSAHQGAANERLGPWQAVPTGSLIGVGTREEQDRGDYAGRPEPSQQGLAAGVGQVVVQHEHGVRPIRALALRLPPVCGMHHLEWRGRRCGQQASHLLGPVTSLAASSTRSPAGGPLPGSTSPICLCPSYTPTRGQIAHRHSRIEPDRPIVSRRPPLMFLLLAQLFGVAALCSAVVFAAPLAQRWTQSQPMPRCEVGQSAGVQLWFRCVAPRSGRRHG